MKAARFHRWGGLAAAILLAAGQVVVAQFGDFGLGDVVKGASGAKNLGKGLTGISLQEELDMGGSLAVGIAEKMGGVLKDEAATKRVATIGKALAYYSIRPELPWTFGILDNPSVNAISAPGGYVFVTKGLLATCKDDNQLAAVIAHEIAHVTRRHALKLIARNQGLKGITELASVAGGSDVGAFDNLIEKALTSMLEKGFDPDTENDADRHGTLLLHDAGFAPNLLRDFLAEMAKQSDSKNFSTHPPTEDRVERLDKYIKEL